MQESFNRVWAIALLLGFIYLLLGVFQPLGIFGEGFIVYGAERVMRGEIPYRDFAANYTPAQFYNLAGLFRLFGCSILVERTWDTLVRFGICVLALLICRRLVPTKSAIFAPLVSLLFLAHCGSYAYPVIPAMFFSFLSILLVLRFFSEPSAPLLFVAGGATSAAVLYRQDIGTCAFFSISFTLMVSPVIGSRFEASHKDSMRQCLHALFRFGIGVSSILVPVVCYFLASVPRSDLQMDFLEFLPIHLRFRHLPLPPLIPSFSYLLSSVALVDVWFVFYGPLAVYLISMVGLFRSARKAQEQGRRERQRGRLLLTTFGLLLYLQTLGRADLMHCIAPTLPACILIALLPADWPNQKRRPWKVALVVLCLAVLAVPYIIIPIDTWCVHLDAYAPWKGTSSLRRARYFHLDPDQESAARFVQNTVPEGQEIFVGNSQHHQVFASNVLFYFLSERGAGTRYYEFTPGITTTASVQQRVIADLEKSHVEYVVQCASPYLSTDGKEVLPDSGVTLLDDYLREHYRSIRKFGDYTIFRKKVAGDTEGKGEGIHETP